MSDNSEEEKAEATENKSADELENEAYWDEEVQCTKCGKAVVRGLTHCVSTVGGDERENRRFGIQTLCGECFAQLMKDVSAQNERNRAARVRNADLRVTSEMGGGDVVDTLRRLADELRGGITDREAAAKEIINAATRLEDFLSQKGYANNIYKHLANSVAWLDAIMRDEEEGITVTQQKSIAEDLRKAKDALRDYTLVNFEVCEGCDDARRRYNEWVEKVWDEYKKAGFRVIPPLPEWLFMENFADRAIPHKDITIE